MVAATAGAAFGAHHQSAAQSANARARPQKGPA